MIINGNSLLRKAPIANMITGKCPGPGGVTYGLGEAGYDIRIKQQVEFRKLTGSMSVRCLTDWPSSVCYESGRFIIASAVELFHMPQDLVGVVHDKSSWARKGLSVFNTVIEPGWHGYLTLELVYHGNENLIIPAGAGIAQVMFHEVLHRKQYIGRYQNQEDRPVPTIETI